MESAKSNKRIQLLGILTAADWDDDGNPIELMISATDETEYFVIDSVKKKNLFKLIQKPVKIEGTVNEDISGRKLIRITKYQAMQEFEEEEDDLSLYS